jgi:carboxyl-terminal processing protease
LAAAMAAVFAAVPPAFAGSVDIGSLDNLNIVRKVFSLIKTDYIKKDVKESDLLTGAINGMLESLNDPYSRYLEPDNFKDMQSDTSGEFEGVGIVISIKNKILTVVSPIDNTPAERAGIKSGDKIIKIDGEDADKMNLHDAVNRMRGRKGSKITLTIWRPDFSEPKDFILNRDVIPLKTVKSKIVNDKTGYVRISQFTETTAPDLEKELNDLEAQGIDALILDLRDNPGGLLTSAIDVARKFIDRGSIVTVKSRDGKTLNLSSYYRSHPLYPLIVLINKGSASSSEIVAGAIQDNKRGILIGGKTFGKGVIQTVIPMENNAGLILTTAWYFTPSGRSIHNVGIDPDITIDQTVLTSEEIAELYDTSSSGREAGPQNAATAENILLSAETLKKYEIKTGDIQLIKAIEILKGDRLTATAVYDAPQRSKKMIASSDIDGK